MCTLFAAEDVKRADVDAVLGDLGFNAKEVALAHRQKSFVNWSNRTDILLRARARMDRILRWRSLAETHPLAAWTLAIQRERIFWWVWLSPHADPIRIHSEEDLAIVVEHLDALSAQSLASDDGAEDSSPS